MYNTTHWTDNKMKNVLYLVKFNTSFEAESIVWLLVCYTVEKTISKLKKPSDCSPQLNEENFLEKFIGWMEM